MSQKIDAAAAIRLLDAGKAVAVDVREPDEFQVGHIPGAKLLPLDDIEDADLPEILPDKNARILIYCRTGRRSALAAAQLFDLGYTHLYDLGGLNGWPYGMEYGLL